MNPRIGQAMTDQYRRRYMLCSDDPNRVHQKTKMERKTNAGSRALLVQNYNP